MDVASLWQPTQRPPSWVAAIQCEAPAATATFRLRVSLRVMRALVCWKEARDGVISHHSVRFATFSEHVAQSKLRAQISTMTLHIGERHLLGLICSLAAQEPCSRALAGSHDGMRVRRKTEQSAAQDGLVSAVHSCCASGTAGVSCSPALSHRQSHASGFSRESRLFM